MSQISMENWAKTGVYLGNAQKKGCSFLDRTDRRDRTDWTDRTDRTDLSDISIIMTQDTKLIS